MRDSTTDHCPLSLFPLQYVERCEPNTTSLLLCRTPAVDTYAHGGHVQVEFLLDNLRFDFQAITLTPFVYELNPTLRPLNQHDPSKPFRYKPGSVIAVEVSTEIVG